MNKGVALICVTALTLFFYSRVYFKFFDSNATYNAICLVLVFAVCVFLLLQGVVKEDVGVVVPFYVLLVSLFMGLSSFWSLSSQASMKGAIFFLLSSLIIMVLFRELYYRFCLNEIYSALFLFFFISMWASVVLHLVGMGQMTEGEYAGVMNGIFPHKNFLARMAVMSIVLSFMMPLGSAKKMLLLIPSVYSMFMAGSVGAPIYAVLAFISMHSIQMFIKGSKARIQVVVGGVLVLISLLFLIAYLDILLNNIGKDLTFTGRTFIWEYALEFISERPVLGFGYEAFWPTQNGMILNLYGLFWDVPHAHNGFLDLLLELGLVGLLFFLIIFFFAIKSFGTLLSNPEWTLAFFIVLYVFFTNVLEKSSFQYFDIQWGCFIGLIYVAELAVRQRKVVL
jgi:exopolysaccharide production protein ExoQ